MSAQPQKLVFLDETCLKSNLIKLSGWAPSGQRLVDHVPHGCRGTQTLIAALRHDELAAPWVISGAMNSELFCLYIETQLAPTLSPGDLVILDNLSSHKHKRAAQLLEQIGVRLLFLPPYSPDFNPIEMAFSKLKGLIRKSAARTYDELWQAVGNVCNLFSPDECANYFEAAGYVQD